MSEPVYTSPQPSQPVNGGEKPSTLIKSDNLSVARPPHLVISEAQRAAKALKRIIDANPATLVLNGKTYLRFEDWQTLGRFYGVTALCSASKYIEYGEGDEKVRGFEAKAEALLVINNQVISSAEAMCLNDEPQWSRKPFFQLKSMAQTRACAKALRNVLAWVVVLAGYQPTPAEEMGDENGSSYGVQPPRRKSAMPVKSQMDELNEVFPSDNRPPRRA